MKEYSSGAANCRSAACFNMVSFGETKLGKIGETISEKSGLKRRFLGKKRDFKAVFQNSDLPLTPSFVGSNPATPAIGAIYCVMLQIYTQYIAPYFLPANFYAKNCGVVCGVNCGVKAAEKTSLRDAACFLYVFSLF